MKALIRKEEEKKEIRKFKNIPKLFYIISLRFYKYFKTFLKVVSVTIRILIVRTSIFLLSRNEVPEKASNWAQNIIKDSTQTVNDKTSNNNQNYNRFRKKFLTVDFENKLPFDILIKKQKFNINSKSYVEKLVKISKR